MTKSQTGFFRFWHKSLSHRGTTKWEMPPERTHHRLRTLHNFCHWLRSQIATVSSEEMMCLKSYVIFHVFSFYSSHCKYAMPFQQQHSFYRWVNFMHISRHLWSIGSLSPQTFSWTCALVFIEMKWPSLPSCARLCLRIDSGKQIKFPRLVPCKSFELHSTLAKPAVVALSFSQMGLRTLKTSRSASMVSPSFFTFHMK